MQFLLGHTNEEERWDLTKDQYYKKHIQFKATEVFPICRLRGENSLGFYFLQQYT